MQFSRSVTLIPDPEIKRISELAENYKCTRFDIGEPDFETPEHIKKTVLEAIRNGFTHYTSTYGIEELRGAIANKEMKKNQRITKNNVMVTSGGMGALFCSLKFLLRRNEKVLLPDPFWAPYSYIVRVAGGTPVPITFYEDDELCIDRIEKNLDDKVKSIIVNTPQNPTGKVMKEHELKKIFDLTASYDIAIISDEVYEKIIFEGNHTSISKFDETMERTFIINSLSKTYAMTGWRVGYLITNPEYMKHLVKINRSTVTCASSISQKAALTAINGPQNCVDEMVREYKKRRDYTLKRIKELDWQCEKPQGTFYAFPFIGEDDQKFAIDAIKKAGVSMVPGSAFGSNGIEHLRIAFTVSMDSIEEGFDKLEKLNE